MTYIISLMNAMFFGRTPYCRVQRTLSISGLLSGSTTNIPSISPLTFSLYSPLFTGYLYRPDMTAIPTDAPSVSNGE
jgi:hypothetical protein